MQTIIDAIGAVWSVEVTQAGRGDYWAAWVGPEGGMRVEVEIELDDDHETGAGGDVFINRAGLEDEDDNRNLAKLRYDEALADPQIVVDAIRDHLG